MPKITTEEKELFYKLYEQGYRGRTIATRIGINNSYARRIIHSFDNGDFSWLKQSFRHYENAKTELEQVKIVQLLLDAEKSYPEMVKATGLPKDVLIRWVRNYTKYGVCTRRRGRPQKEGCDDNGSGESQRTRKETERKAGRAYCLQSLLPNLCGKRDRSSKKKILRAVSQCRRFGIPLKTSLSILKLSPSTYHFWKKHENEVPVKDRMLAEAIRYTQEKNHWAYGAKRMAKHLVLEGVYDELNHKRVARVMDYFDLHAKVRRRRYPKNYYLTLKENADSLPRNDLCRNFLSDRPMKKLVTDITYLPTKEGWLYLAAVMDLWNKEIVSYRTSRFIGLHLVKNVVKELTDQGLILNQTMIHSDTGWTYTNRVYVEFLKNLGVHQSMSRKGNCWDNACIENFFGLFKSETIKQMPKRALLTVDGMEKLVDDYIYWFNNQRIQKKLGYLSPVNYRNLAT